jgi:DMSO/TMAO reductase YedYZ molybdopterin-dependent catalytic subunit
VRTYRGAWPLAGLVAGFAGLAASYFVAMAMSIRESPVVAVAEQVIRLTPGKLAERAIQVLGHNDKPFLVAVILVVTAGCFAYAGHLARRSWWAPSLVLVGLAVLAGAAVVLQPASSAINVLPVVVGLVVWLICLSLLTDPMRRAASTASTISTAGVTPASPVPTDTTPGDDVATPAGPDPTRRGFLLRAGTMTALGVALWLAGHRVGGGRRHVEETRRLLRLPGVTPPRVPARARLDVEGITPWMTPAEEFYQVHTAIVVPTIEPADWSVRIHGMVDREVRLSYEDLLARELTESWITLNCVSNPVGGSLIGNARWSGVRLADLLHLAGVHPDADAVLQTSEDGWTCGTPLAALTDHRDAMLAVAMNGKPLPIEHGFPVRTIVPGLYGYVSACKWVVDLEVSQFSKIDAYWTQRGWSEQGPVKIASRIDVPGSGAEVRVGDVRIGGVAWAQHTGIEAVEIALDGGEWQRVEISHPPTNDTWVQWATTVPTAEGDHVVRVRATDKTGTTQTGVDHDVLPDGATGWHAIGFTARA